MLLSILLLFFTYSLFFIYLVKEYMRKICLFDKIKS